MPRERMDAKMNETYVATLELDPRSHQWMADIEGLPVHTWGRSLAKVKQYAIEALALHIDVPEAEVAGPPRVPAPAVARSRARASRPGRNRQSRRRRRRRKGGRGKSCRSPSAGPRCASVHAGRGGGSWSLAPASSAVACQLTTSSAHSLDCDPFAPELIEREVAYPQVVLVTWLGGTATVVAAEPSGSSTT